MYTFCYIILSLILLVDAKYACITNTTVYLKINEIAFFETLNYPALISAEQNRSCYITFKLEGGNQTNYRTTVGSLYNNYNNIVVTPNINILSSGASFQISLNKDYIFFQDFTNVELYNSIQGFVVFEEERDNCPLESICQPFVFNDEAQIIYIMSYRLYNLTNSCQWKFISPNGYGFKVVIMEMDSAAKLLVSNSTDIIVNERSLKRNHPYYNDDNFIQIYWYNVPKNIKTNGILASISIVKKYFNYTDGNCIIEKINNNTIKWTNLFYPFTGLQNYVRCIYNLTIPTNTSVLIHTTGWGLEKGVDILRYYRNENDSVEIVDPENEGNYEYDYMLEKNYDGIDKNVLFEFKSDGSVSSMGFILEITLLACKCNTIIYCNVDLNQTIMGGTDERYCENLRCNLTIQPCPTGYGYMRLQVSQRKKETSLDVFKIISNDEIILQIDNSNRGLDEFDAFLNSSNINILEVITFPSYLANLFMLTYEPFKLPSSYDQIILAIEFPYYIIDLRMHILPVIEISDNLKSKNLSIVIYRPMSILNDISVYNNQSLTYNYNGNTNCFIDTNKCEIKSNKIAIFEDNNPNNWFYLVAVRLSETFEDGCVFPEIIFSTKWANIFNVSAIANNKGICDIILLLDNIYEISYLWTTAKNESVKVFIGLDKKRLYFEFNSASAQTWQRIGLLSNSYIIEIPKGAAVLITIKDFLNGPPLPLTFPHNSLFTTPFFGISKLTDGSNYYPLQYWYSNVGKDVSLKFTALYYNISSEDTFYFVTIDEILNTPKVININETGDSVTLAVPIGIIYNFNLDSDEAIFFVETIDNTVV